MKKLLFLFTALFLSIGLLSSARADERYAAVNFYADWCGSCKILDPKIEKARENITSDSIQFYTFDMTNSESIAHTKKIAKAEELDAVLQKYGAATGFMVIYDRETKEILRIVTSGYSVKDITKTFKKLNKENS